MVATSCFYSTCCPFSSSTSDNQQEALSAASPILLMVVFLDLSCIPSVRNMLHNERDGNPLQPISTGSTHVFHPFSMQLACKSVYLSRFRWYASSTRSSRGTVNSTITSCLMSLPTYIRSELGGDNLLGEYQLPVKAINKYTYDLCNRLYIIHYPWTVTMQYIKHV